MGGRYLDDFTVGQRFESPSQVITAEDIKSFARQFDPQPFHLDEEIARHSAFGGLVASGWHTAAVTMRLFPETGIDVVCGIIGRGVDELAWLAPVRPGDALSVEAVVKEVRRSRTKPDQGTVRVELTTRNQRNEPVQRMVANLYVPRRPSGSAG